MAKVCEVPNEEGLLFNPTHLLNEKNERKNKIENNFLFESPK